MNHNKKDAPEKESNVMSYVIGFNLIGILVLGTFFLPQFYNYRMDQNNLGKVHYEEREVPSFGGDISVPVKDRTAILTNLVEQNDIYPSMTLEEKELRGGAGGEEGGLQTREVLEKTWEQVEIMAADGMLPDGILNYGFDTGLDMYTLCAEYYVVNSGVSEFGDMALWRIVYTDYQSFEFCYLVDAENYKIYYMELYYTELADERDWFSMLETDDPDTGLMAKCLAYYEGESAGPIMDNMLFELDDCGSYGWVKLSGKRWQYKYGTEVVMGFNVFVKKFRKISLEEYLGIPTENNDGSYWEERETSLKIN